MKMLSIARNQWLLSWSALPSLCCSFYLCGIDSRPSLLDDLVLCEQIDRREQDRYLPLILNANLQPGAFLTPSARMNPDGLIALGGAATRPFLGAGLSLQMLPRLNLAINYQKLGVPIRWSDLSTGWRQALKRQTLLRWQLFSESDFGGHLPCFAIGTDDLFGSGVLSHFYAVGTQSFSKINLEASLGWNHGVQSGWFASAIWSPFRFSETPFQGFSLIAEWANSPQKHLLDGSCTLPHSHRLHAGITYKFKDFLQVSVASLGGHETYAGISLQANLGPPVSGIPKILDRPYQSVAANLEPIGPLRSDRELALELSQSFSDHGLVLQGAWLQTGETGGRELRLRVVNQTYRWESEVRTRLERILGLLVPDGISSVIVVLTANGADVEEIRLNTADLRSWFSRDITSHELRSRSLSFPVETLGLSTPLFKRPLHTWQWDVQPYTESVWLKEMGGSQGIYGIAIGPQGYLSDHYFYRARVNITGWNGLTGCSEEQLLTPSPTVLVRSDMILYNLQGKLRLSEAFVQRTWSFSRGFYLRASAGYYDLAFGGAALEALWFPVGSCWAIGLEAAPLLKRLYGGFGFTSTARFGNGCSTPCRSFFPWQVFLDAYGFYEPWSLEVKASFGHFLARDVGCRLEATRFWPSGLRLTVWGSWSRLPDSAGGAIYADRGVGFSLPLDIFLPKRSRGRYQYGTGAIYPDIGARVTTGIPLYRTIADERMSMPDPNWIF